MNNMLLWWTLDSIPLSLVIKSKIVKEALQWRSEGRAQLQSYFNQAELTSEFNSVAITSLLLKGTFVRRTTDLEKNFNMNLLPFSLR